LRRLCCASYSFLLHWLVQLLKVKKSQPFRRYFVHKFKFGPSLTVTSQLQTLAVLFLVDLTGLHFWEDVFFENACAELLLGLLSLAILPLLF
jgi:hypothetical protein